MSDEGNKETVTFKRYVVTRWKCDPHARYTREYLGRAMNGELIETTRGGARVYQSHEWYQAGYDRDLATGATRLDSRSCAYTPWRIATIKVTATLPALGAAARGRLLRQARLHRAAAYRSGGIA